MKKATGVVRSADALGRFVLPIEVRRTLGIGPGTPVEFYTDGDMVCLKKYNPTADIIYMLDEFEKGIKMNDCMISTDQLDKLLAKLGEMKAIIMENA